MVNHVEERVHLKKKVKPLHIALITLYIEQDQINLKNYILIKWDVLKLHDLDMDTANPKFNHIYEW